MTPASAGVVAIARVDVVTPCYNAEHYVADTLRSLLGQTMPAWNATLVDDASTDGTVEVLAALVGADPRIRLIRQPVNRGVASARNLGASAGSSDYLLFLDADDTLEPEMLAATTDYLDAHPEVSAVYTRHSYIGPAGEDLGAEPGQWPWARCVASRGWIRMLPSDQPVTPFESIFIVAVMLPSMTVMRRPAFVAAGGWDETFGHGCEDTDLFLRLALEGPIHHLPRLLVNYRRHPGQSIQSWDFEKQYNKLMDKWSSMAGLDEMDAQRVDDAIWFRRHRFVPYRQIQQGAQCLRAGKWREGLRLLVSGAKDYSPRRPPSTLSQL